jgi:hypothetical protein
MAVVMINGVPGADAQLMERMQTTLEFRPTLQRQRDHAAEKGRSPA